MAAARVQDLLRSSPVPGLYERALDATPPALLRLDTTAFVGLCAEVPAAQPQVVESWSAFVESFGPPGGGRQLPEAVLHFFLNGGRRAVILAAPRDEEPTPDSLLDLLDLLGEDTQTEPVALLAVPDLFHRAAPAPLAARVEAAPSVLELRFQEQCLPQRPERTEASQPRWPELERRIPVVEIVKLLQRVRDYAERGRRMALIDLPPDLDSDEIHEINQGLQSGRGGRADRVALYAPWLMTPAAEDPRGPARPFPPSGAVAGRIAWREQRDGPGRAPANLPLRGAPALYRDPYLPSPSALHGMRVNLIRETPQGLYLMGASTLSEDPQWRPIGTRRLMDWLCGQLALDCRWAAFEPSGPRLWRRLELCAIRRLRALFEANALAGPDEASSYFVRCDAETNRHQPEGAAVVLVGVAPATPAEFIVFQLQLMRDGTSEVHHA